LFTTLKVNDKGDATDLGNAVQCIMQYALKNNLDLNFMSKAENDTEIYTYLSYLQSIFENLKSVRGKYNTYEEYRDDVKEFKKLYELSSELT
jgi:hypothetical protein